jgi:hypothetical protein
VDDSHAGLCLEVPDVRQNVLLVRLHDAEPENSTPGGALGSKLSMTTKYATQEYLSEGSYRTMWSVRPKVLGHLRVPLCGLATDVPGESLEWSVAGCVLRLRVMFFCDEKPEIQLSEADKPSNPRNARPSSAPCGRRRGSRDGVVAGSAQGAARVRGFRGCDTAQAQATGHLRPDRPATAPSVRSPTMSVVEEAKAGRYDCDGRTITKDWRKICSQDWRKKAGSNKQELPKKQRLAACQADPGNEPQIASSTGRPRSATAQPLRSVTMPQSVRPGRYGAETHGKSIDRPPSAHGSRQLSDNGSQSNTQAHTHSAIADPQQHPRSELEDDSYSFGNDEIPDDIATSFDGSTDAH